MDYVDNNGITWHICAIFCENCQRCHDNKEICPKVLRELNKKGLGN